MNGLSVGLMLIGFAILSLCINLGWPLWMPPRTHRGLLYTLVFALGLIYGGIYALTRVP